MRVAVYVDGFNLYKRGQALAGNALGWKWLDIRALAATLAVDEWPPGPHEISRVVYCTTWVKPTLSNPDGPQRQETFINALKASGSVDWVEFGLFVEKVKTRPLAVANRRGRPILVQAELALGADVERAEAEVLAEVRAIAARLRQLEARLERGSD